MTCHETRELLSALLDDALDSGERARVETHLAGCPDCRRELEGLRATTSLLSRVERARAPVGFVDKVMAGVQPVPWYRRLGRAVFLPLSVKLPIETGAMVVIALLGVYLLQSTPELRDAARPDLPAAASRPEAPPPPAPPAPAPAPSPPAPMPSKERDAMLKREAPPSGASRDRANVARSSEAPPAPPEAKREMTPPATEPGKPEPLLPRSSMSKTLDVREGSAGRADASRESAPSAAPPAPSTMSAKQQVSPPTVSGVLTVKDRQQSERALAGLISRTGAREVGRQQEGGATVIDVLVPQAAYAAFTKELADLGTYRTEGQPAEIPAVVRISIRITE